MDERILILAPRGRDSHVIAESLANLGYRSLICSDLGALTDALQENAGAAVLTEEALAQDGTQTLSAWLAAQPPWSDFPFIVLVTKQPGKRAKADAARLQAMGNIVLLERPINA
ncbi:MAG: hybrid sensor histidine kinase/response regulator, partial [Hyphomicrobiales bacterium]